MEDYRLRRKSLLFLVCLLVQAVIIAMQARSHAGI